MITALPWQQSCWQQLLAQRLDKRLAHAYLLTGTEGIGKLHFARAFAAAALCRDSTPEGACGQCKSCHLWLAGNHPDLMTVVPETQGKALKIEQVRQVSDFVQQTASYHGSMRVVLLAPAEALGIGAANALLKSLEEPPGHCLFLLVSHVPGAVLATIRSRCQLLALPQADEQSTRQWLATELPDDDSASAAALAPRQPLLAKQWWQEGVPALLERLQQLESRLQQGEVDIVTVAGELSGQNLRHVVQFTQLRVAGHIRQQMLQHKNNAALRHWFDFYQQLERWRQQLDGSANPNAQLTLEILLLDWRGHLQS